MLFRSLVSVFNSRGLEWAKIVMKALATPEENEQFYKMEDVHPILRLYSFPRVLEDGAIIGLVMLAVHYTNFTEDEVRCFLRFIHNFRKQPTTFFDKYSYGLFLREEACVFDGDGFAYLNSVCATPNDELYIKIFFDYLCV